MLRSSAFRAVRSVSRIGPGAYASRLADVKSNLVLNNTANTPSHTATSSAFRKSFSASIRRASLTPDNKPPEPPAQEPPRPVAPANLTMDEFHREADQYLEMLQMYFEYLQDKQDDILDVELSSGVLTIQFAPNARGEEVGTYVVNKQPPNKQIWLSSPKSGPKRYDFVVMGDGMHEKQETGRGEWMYLRDKTTLDQLFKEELGLDLKIPSGEF